jgi:predicted  nucleic acid-binding Zn-ribbon protein
MTLSERVEKGKAAIDDLRHKWTTMEREFAEDGVDASERALLKQVGDKIDQLETAVQRLASQLEHKRAEWKGNSKAFAGRIADLRKQITDFTR